MKAGMATKPQSADAPVKRRVRDPAATRARILEAAERLFAEQGFDGVSMPVIAEAASVTAGAIYRHFENKADLFFQVLRRVTDAVPPESAATREGVSGLPAIVAGYARPRMKRFRQLAVEAHYAAARDPDVGRLLQRSLERNIGGIAESLAAAQAEGLIAREPDPKLLSTAVLVFILGQMHLETLAPSLVGDPAWRALVEDRVAAMLGLGVSDAQAD
jgi:AcrR family transcriptional regulator